MTHSKDLWNKRKGMKEFNEDEFKRRMATIRELAEETNIVLSYPSNIKKYHGKVYESVHANEGDWFLKFCKQNQVEPDIGCLIPFTRWVTPVAFKPRFDTFFYFAPVEEHQLEGLAPHPGEIDRLDWFCPDEAIVESQSQSIQLAPPTLVQLTDLAKLERFSDIERWSNPEFPPAILPELFLGNENEKTCIVFPGDREHSTSKFPDNSSQRRVYNPMSAEKDYTEKPKTFPGLCFGSPATPSKSKL